MQRNYRKWKDQRRIENAVGAFFTRWYGDGCPPWTWPLSTFLIGLAIIFIAQRF